VNAFVPVAVPPGVVITTFTAPAAWAGVVTVIVVSLFTVIAPVAFAVLPKDTLVAPVKPVPVIITLVPPAIGPVEGVMLVKVGCGTIYVYAPVPPVAVPFGVVITTFTVPAAWAGVIAETVVGLITVTPVAAVPPMVTAVAPIRPVPVIVTPVPPAIGPVEGVMLVKIGRGS